MRWFRGGLGDWFMVVVVAHVVVTVCVTLIVVKAFDKDSAVDNPNRVVFHLGGQEENLIVSIGGQVIAGADLNKFCEIVNNDPKCQEHLSLLAQSSADHD